MLSTYRHGRPTIGVLAGWQFYRTATNLSYLAPVFRGITKASQNLGCNLLLGCGMGPSASPTDPLRPAWPVPSPDHDFVPIGPWNTDGLIIAVPLHSEARSEYVQGLIATRHPILFIGSGEAGPSIVVNNTAGILDALRHLVEHGHQQIAFIAGTLDDMQGDTGDRLRAYRTGCELYGLNKDPHLIAYGRHVYDGGFYAIQQIMDSGAKFTAVLASNDESALGAMQALKNAGRKIPQDVAIIGFDNRLEGSVQEPGLTSIHAPLFDIGYHAVDLLLQRIEGKVDLPETIKVDTRLVVRESCGCGAGIYLAGKTEPVSAERPFDKDNQYSKLARTIATTILNQAHSLTEEEGLVLCQQLIDTFAVSIQDGDRSPFQKALVEILQRTAASDDDAHIWQDAISLLDKEWGQSSAPTDSLAHDLLNEARLTISAHMQRQHRQYIVDERWTASRLSLLTARLLTALDEAQIYTILSKHLPDMDIHTAWLALFDAEGTDSVAWSLVHNTLNPDQEIIRWRSQEFPPPTLYSGGQQFLLTLIPLMDQSGQLGFMAFDTEYFDLYGSIVQQVGSALNTARLYRQATEGRRLAEEANRMKSRFLSTISHELRTPLNLIVGLSGIVLQESEEGKSSLPEPAQKDVERIHAYAQHLGGLIGDVLDLATFDAGQLRLTKELIDLGKALEIVADSGRQLATDKGLTWRANIPASALWVWGDRTRLRQVALNLVNNAIKFTERGEVSLSLETHHDWVTVSVHDTGLGIPVEEQAAIFDEFRRSERSIELGYSGLGLGLAVCKMLVEMHGGSIGIYSPGNEGEGSTFYFTLPLEPPPAHQQSQPGFSLSSEQSVLVLINRARTSDRLCALLNQHGVKVQEALMERPADWQSKLLASPPDAIILDVSIESELGWRTLKAIKSNQATKGIPTMFYTSSPNAESLLNLDYLTKPIELAELTQALDQYWLLADPTQPERTFLVVDDEPNTLEMQARIIKLQSASNRVLMASHGLEALKILQQEKVDLVLLDLQMPEMDGFGVLEAMRENVKTREIPVIVVTGRVLTEADMTRLNQGVAVVLKKGLFSLDETLAHIGAALERKRRLSVDAQRLVRQAMIYLHDHYAEPISRRDIAHHVSIAEDYLTFCFRQELGTTPIKYLQRYRVNQAKTLLKNSHKTITEIAREVGFSDSGYFSRVFHRETGMSPEIFRLV